MTAIVSVLTILLFAAIVVGFWMGIELLQGIATSGRDAARAALRHEYEEHLIDADAFAKGLRALDEAA